MAEKSKEYTIGEIFRLKLLKNHKGEPYRNKSEVGRIVNRLNWKKRKTPWGIAKVLSIKEVENWNNRLK